MLPEIDLRTVTFISSIYCLVFGIGLLFTAQKSPQQRGLYSSAIADIFIAASMMAIFLRGAINTEISIQLTNAFIHIALIISHRALVLFRESSAQKIFYIAYTLLAIQLLVIIYYTYHEPNLQARIVIISLVICAQYLLMAYSLFQTDKESLTQSQKLFNYAPLLFAGIFLLRAIATLFEQQPNSFLNASYLHSITISSILIFVIMKDFGMIICILEKSMQNLEKSARTDALTHLYNRRGLNEISERELNKLLRHQQPLTLVICDLDDFKNINDNYGHNMGDKALKKFADILQSNTRDVDICARLGGDEFIMIFPSTSLEQTAIIVNKIKKKLATTIIEKGYDLKLSASFGIASYRDGMNLEALINAADKALYDSKSRKPSHNISNITNIMAS